MNIFLNFNKTTLSSTSVVCFSFQCGTVNNIIIIYIWTWWGLKACPCIACNTNLNTFFVLQMSRRKRKAFLIVEGIYTNTGKICNLPKLIDIRIKYKIRIFIDETISFGILGKKGRGVTEHYNIPVRIFPTFLQHPNIQMSKLTFIY